jgi:hypothetical protein
MRPGVRGQRSAEVEPAKPLERCTFFCRTVRWETLHLKAMAEGKGSELELLKNLQGFRCVRQNVRFCRIADRL